MLKNEELIPVLTLRGFVMFPNMILHFDVERKKSISAIEKAMSSNGKMFMVAQKNVKYEDPDGDDLYSVGVLVTVKQVLKQMNNTIKVVAEGNFRAKAVKYVKGDDFLRAEIVEMPDVVCECEAQSEALLRTIEKLFLQYLSLLPKTPKDLALRFPVDGNIGEITDYIASNIMLGFEGKQELLSIADPVCRAELLVDLLSREIKIISYELDIGLKLQKSLDNDQKEYLIKEQIKFLKEELGENSVSEADEYRKKLDKLILPKETYEKFWKECNNLSKLPSSSSEANILSTYLDICLNLPWNISSDDSVDIKRAESILNSDHYGLKDVKERILEFLAAHSLSEDLKGQIICLVGPPGIGKTSIVKSLAKSIGRKYVRISLGGVSDESEIRGHRRTYLGAMPGRIMTAIKQVQVNNPLILFDEIDKLSNDYRGDPASALLEALDPEQNSEFYDRYVAVPFDLSKVLFVATANDKDGIPAPLYDRMEVIDLCSYTNEEKFQIAKNHLIPKQLKRHGLSKRQFSISDGAINSVISGYTREAGVRELERNLSSLMRKAAKSIVDGTKKSSRISEKNLEQVLGAVKFKNKIIDKGERIGVANGLAWTSVGGELLPIEASLMPGKGEVQLTGSLGDVMQESIQLCVSYVRSNSKKLGINKNFYKDYDIHIHAPEGAVPKDGPSAGITILTSLVSALTNIPVCDNVAMTGELTLKGRVLAIGGLKEKVTAAYKAGMRKVLIPSDNISDLEKVDKSVKEKIEFIPVDNVETVLSHALTREI